MAFHFDKDVDLVIFTETDNAGANVKEVAHIADVRFRCFNDRHLPDVGLQCHTLTPVTKTVEVHGLFSMRIFCFV